jgi:hypothetical protein
VVFGPLSGGAKKLKAETINDEKTFYSDINPYFGVGLYT